MKYLLVYQKGFEIEKIQDLVEKYSLEKVKEMKNANLIVFEGSSGVCIDEFLKDEHIKSFSPEKAYKADSLRYTAKDL